MLLLFFTNLFGKEEPIYQNIEDIYEHINDIHADTQEQFNALEEKLNDKIFEKHLVSSQIVCVCVCVRYYY